MTAFLIALNGSFLLTEVPPSMRRQCYLIADRQPTSVRYGEWTEPQPIKTRTFVWRGQIVRKNGDELFDLFEEVP